MQISARRGVLTYLGDTSYALYLSHAPVVVAVSYLLCRWTALPVDAIAVAATAASVLVAWRIHELVEKPLLAWIRRPTNQPALA